MHKSGDRFSDGISTCHTVLLGKRSLTKLLGSQRRNQSFNRGNPLNVCQTVSVTLREGVNGYRSTVRSNDRVADQCICDLRMPPNTAIPAAKDPWFCHTDHVLECV